MIWKNILYIFLFFSSVFACGVCPSVLCSFLHTNLCSYLPVASIAAIFSFNQRQINICCEGISWSKRYFERHFSISSILSEKRSRLQAHFVLNYTLLAERSHPIIGVKVIQCLLQKKPLKCDLTIQDFCWLFHTVLAISAVSAWKNKGEKGSLMYKKT